MDFASSGSRTSAPQAEPEGGPGVRSPKNRVLVVEDERHTREALQRFLLREGFEVLGFGTAAEVQAWLDASRTESAGPGSVAGAIIDIHLPDGDGIDLTRSIRDSVGGTVRIVIVSGDTSMDTLRRLRDAGGDRFVGKPMSLAVVREALVAPAEIAQATPAEAPPNDAPGA